MRKLDEGSGEPQLREVSVQRNAFHPVKDVRQIRG